VFSPHLILFTLFSIKDICLLAFVGSLGSVILVLVLCLQQASAQVCGLPLEPILPAPRKRTSDAVVQKPLERIEAVIKEQTHFLSETAVLIGYRKRSGCWTSSTRLQH